MKTLIERIYEEARRFSFFEAVHLLETLQGKRPGLGEGMDPSSEPVRFSVRPDLVFPASEIEAIEPSGDGSPPRMNVTFMGLVGPSGVLPYWYTELACERIRQKDEALASFLDIFHHRLVSLFYLAWKRYRICENYAGGGTDPASRRILCLCGLGTFDDMAASGIDPEIVLFCAGHFATAAPSAASIESAVSYLTGVRARVEQFVERSIKVASEDRTRLGTANASLGVDAVCGEYIADASGFFRIHLGPMGYEEFTRFLPGADMLGRVFNLVRLRAGLEYEFDLKVILDRRQVPSCMLGGQARLGMTSWLIRPGSALGENAFIILGEDTVQ